uniref:Metalloendopeptidase n=1 Tax=Strongyloides stercoralis TaxID=6248 RepID=A0A0K0EAG8_STRER
MESIKIILILFFITSAIYHYYIINNTFFYSGKTRVYKSFKLKDKKSDYNYISINEDYKNIKKPIIGQKNEYLNYGIKNDKIMKNGKSSKEEINDLNKSEDIYKSSEEKTKSEDESSNNSKNVDKTEEDKSSKEYNNESSNDSEQENEEKEEEDNDKLKSKTEDSTQEEEESEEYKSLESESIENDNENDKNDDTTEYVNESSNDSEQESEEKEEEDNGKLKSTTEDSNHKEEESKKYKNLESVENDNESNKDDDTTEYSNESINDSEKESEEKEDNSKLKSTTEDSTQEEEESNNESGKKNDSEEYSYESSKELEEDSKDNEEENDNSTNEEEKSDESESTESEQISDEKSENDISSNEDAESDISVVESDKKNNKNVRKNNKKNVSKNNRFKRYIKSSRIYKWMIPIRYFNENVKINLVKKALDIIEEQTCIKFIEVKNILKLYEGIRFCNGSECTSIKRKKHDNIWHDISINKDCSSVGEVQYEILKTLGLHEEHNRIDRNDYIHIIKENMDPTKINEFKILPIVDLKVYKMPYDYGSLMHADQHMYAKSYRPTILPKYPLYEETIGQKSKLSFLDIKTLNYYYCSKKCWFKLKCLNGGYQDPNNCERCKCVEGFTGIFCQKIINSSQMCGKSLLIAKSTSKTLSLSGLKNCIYHIKAIKNRKIGLFITGKLVNKLTKINCGKISRNVVCSPYFSLEIKYLIDKTITGARLCGKIRNKIIFSKNNYVIVYYNSLYFDNYFTLKYKQF